MLLNFLQKMHVLKDYERVKSKMAKADSQQAQATGLGAIEENQETEAESPLVEHVSRKDYMEYFNSLLSCNYKKKEKIIEYIHEIKAH